MPPSSSASTTTARGPARRRRPLSITGRNQTVGSEVGHQRRRNGDRPVGLLAGLPQGGGGARPRPSRRVGGGDELRPVARPGAAAGVGGGAPGNGESAPTPPP